MDLADKICNECPARAANNCPYENFPHLKRKCEYRSDVMYGYDLAIAELLEWARKRMEELEANDDDWSKGYICATLETFDKINSL